jgi:hypothetical protein
MIYVIMVVGLLQLFIILIQGLWLDFVCGIDWTFILIVLKANLFKQMADGFQYGSMILTTITL